MAYGSELRGKDQAVNVADVILAVSTGELALKELMVALGEFMDSVVNASVRAAEAAGDVAEDVKFPQRIPKATK